MRAEPNTWINPIDAQVTANAMIASADGSYGRFAPINCRYGPNAGRSSRLAIVNSPITTANVRNAPDRMPERIFGKITLNRMVGQFAPRHSAASVSERTSTARRPASTARYMYGRDSVT